ncbi:unannotated protein [freshwater metagenome]|uniref:Unannotated protein n=1 Tax=freshwater metagenome TaxID=449393 RepID=A0A6J6QB87_9ZZZZ
MSRRRALALVAVAAAIPRLIVLLHERGAMLASYVEKSDILARQFLASGTFGYVPGEPSASTQPLYGWFMICIYWVAGRHWWTLGTAQVAVSVLTAILVCELGRRTVSLRAGIVAAVIATWEPYLLWHDVHVNREILDQPIGVAMFLLAAQGTLTRRRAALLGVISGVAVLSNSRLIVFPIVLAIYLLWRGTSWRAAILVPVLAAVAVAPWVVRNKVEVGCFAMTTDARALWKANNVNTYTTLAAGKWIDDVPDLAGRPPTPQDTGTTYDQTGEKVHVDECAQQSSYTKLVFTFWREHPGEKAKLAAQATRMIWDPRVGLDEGRNGQGGALDTIRTWIEPVYVLPLYLLAIVGLFFVPLPLRILSLLFIIFETAEGWVFAGTTRYRVSWDWVLALLAVVALSRTPLERPFKRTSSQ